MQVVFMKKRTSLPLWKQYALGMSLLFPWIAFGILSTDVLPESWRFHNWLQGIQNSSILLFVIFVVADFAFAFWYLLRYSHEHTAA